MTDISDDIMTFSGALSDEFFARVEGDGEGEADVIIDLISRAMMRERERDGWQPIETAPKDEVVLLGWWDEWPQRMWTQDVGVYHDTRAGSLHSLAQFWQPLPPSPKPAAVSEGGEDEYPREKSSRENKE